jgi:uncharacterized protein (TIGR02145 family)
MKTKFFTTFSKFWAILAGLFVFTCCQEDPEILISRIATGNLTELTDTSATIDAAFLVVGSLVSDYGHCWAIQPNPSVLDNKSSFAGNRPKSFQTKVLGLNGNTKYFVRAYVKDGNSIYYGNQVEFTTHKTPFVSVTSPTAGSHWMAGETKIIRWESNITENINIYLFKGSVNLADIVLNTPNTGSYSWKLPENTVYGADYQIKVTSVSNPKASGLSTHFKASEKPGTASSLTYNGYTYQIKKIGTQWWMAENLRTAKYNNGLDIPEIIDNTFWLNTSSPAYCGYTSSANTTAYGHLYNWYAANSGNLCPQGWHVPSVDDWTVLTNYLGGESTAGGKLKATGAFWTSPNTGADNESGFTGLPGGYRMSSITAIGAYGCWWSISAVDELNARVYSLNYNNTFLNNNANSKKSGASIRCVRD